jgi:hypothetical protein
MKLSALASDESERATVTMRLRPSFRKVWVNERFILNKLRDLAKGKD